MRMTLEEQAAAAEREHERLLARAILALDAAVANDQVATMISARYDDAIAAARAAERAAILAVIPELERGGWRR